VSSGVSLDLLHSLADKALFIRGAPADALVVFAPLAAALFVPLAHGMIIVEQPALSCCYWYASHKSTRLIFVLHQPGQILRYVFNG
jgi:hypothetical protein